MTKKAVNNYRENIGGSEDTCMVDEMRNGKNSIYIGFGPDKWFEHFPTCGGSSQSPISIDKFEAEASGQLPPVKISTSNENGLLFGYYINDGHGFGMTIDKEQGTATISGGPLGTDTYTLEKIDFHFSCQDKEFASEHIVDGFSHDGEVLILSHDKIQLVFYNTKYPNFNTAMDKSDGLTIMAFFILLSLGDFNKASLVMTHFMEDTAEPVRSAFSKYGMNLYDLLPPLKNMGSKLHYVYYSGSLTRPPCHESVTWMVFPEAVRFSFHEVLKLMLKANQWKKMLGYHGHLCNNVRPPQPLNGRKVHVVELSHSAYD
ncbi:Carbonic anhydrase 1 [Thelohanellus kitauei]|uniref:Carbonic anhydrase 1 n=1 Tax=Thelohanellus kitauei TaxID=669202 RepID=A0A0C2JUY0_THEKT|nr:Carbonic anhydrase 1 [Thelohanellus kitauei]